MIIGCEKHFLHCKELLETDDVDFAGARRWLYQEAKVFMISLTLSNHISRHRHALDALDPPIGGYFSFVFIFRVIIFSVLIFSEILFGPFLFDCRIQDLANLSFLPKVGLWYLDVYGLSVCQIIGFFTECQGTFCYMDMGPIVVS